MIRLYKSQYVCFAYLAIIVLLSGYPFSAGVSMSKGESAIGFTEVINDPNIILDDPNLFELRRTWYGPTLGIPTPLGGLIFSWDGMTLYVVGESELYTSALYEVEVTRDPNTLEILHLGAASLVFSGEPTTKGLDIGWEYGPEGTLFYTYWPANYLGQRPGGIEGPETLFSLAPIGMPTSVAGLTFSPHINDSGTGFGMMQVSHWEGADIFNVPLAPMGDGLYNPITTELFVTLPREGTGAIQYIPSGPLKGNLMYVNYNQGEVLMVEIDPNTGFPIDSETGLPTLGTSTPRTIRFASGLPLRGPWGLEFDPLTNDFLVTTWKDGEPRHTILLFSGEGFPPPPGCQLIIGATEGGTVTMPGEDIFTYDCNELVNIEATSDPNYLFLYWTGTAVDKGKVTDPNSTNTTVLIDGDCTLTAHFTRKINLPVVSATSNTCSDRAILIGHVIDDGGEACYVWFTYQEEGAVNWIKTPPIWPGRSGRNFTTNVTGLKPDTWYFLQAHALNSRGEVESNITAFFTKWVGHTCDLPGF